MVASISRWAGESIRLEGGGVIVGNVLSNGDLDVARQGRIDGDASVTGRARIQGKVSGTLTEGAAPRELPALLSEAELRAWADRTFEGNHTFENERVDDVVFVAGTVRIRGGIQGEGTIIALRDIRFDTEPSSPNPPRAGSETTNDVRLGARFEKGRGLMSAGVMSAAVLSASHQRPGVRQQRA